LARADIEESLNNNFARRLTHLLKTSLLEKKLPIVVSDVKEAMYSIAQDVSGRTDPFESIYRIVFKLTIHMVGAEEIADDLKLLEAWLQHFEMIEQSATPAAVIFPKISSPAIIKRIYAGARLFMIIENLIRRRTQGREKHNDAIQYLLDQDDQPSKIIESIVGALFAGLLNSGINTA
jgi:cytochrome P450